MIKFQMFALIINAYYAYCLMLINQTVKIPFRYHTGENTWGNLMIYWLKSFFVLTGTLKRMQ